VLQIFIQLGDEWPDHLDIPEEEGESEGIPSTKLYACHFILFMTHPKLLECVCKLTPTLKSAQVTGFQQLMSRPLNQMSHATKIVV
jgi:hypothetical protein